MSCYSFQFLHKKVEGVITQKVSNTDLDYLHVIYLQDGMLDGIDKGNQIFYTPN